MSLPAVSSRRRSPCPLRRRRCFLVLLFFFEALYNDNDASATATTTAAAADSERYPYEQALINRGLLPAAATGRETGRGDPQASSPPQFAERQKQIQTEAEICTQTLRDAVNAAISHVIGSRELTDHLLPLWGPDAGGAYVPLLVCGPSVAPPGGGTPQEVSPFAGVSSLPWPEKEALLPDDLLAQILGSGVVRVAGISRGAAQGDTRSPLKGTAAGFTTEPTTGFFPDYLRAIWGAIGRRYQTSVSLSFRFYPSVETAQAAVAAGEADMTDVSFLLSHQNQGVPPFAAVSEPGKGEKRGGELRNSSSSRNPLSFLYMTCPVVGAALLAYTRDKETETFEDLVQSLMQALEKGADPAKTTVVVCTEELRAAVGPILPKETQLQVVESVAVALRAVAEGEAVAAFCLGSSTSVSPPPGVSLREGIDVILATGGWIRRSHSTKCLRREHFADLSRQPAK